MSSPSFDLICEPFCNAGSTELTSVILESDPSSTLPGTSYSSSSWRLSGTLTTAGLFNSLLLLTDGTNELGWSFMTTV